MKICPDCGQELPSAESECPACKKKGKKPFTIREFLWTNFRLFTMIGVTGTMISLIPNMGSRILGGSWITGADNILPFFLSLIILFGAVFMTICFLMIFSLILAGREDEITKYCLTIRSWRLVTWHEGDSQRAALLFCLLPMWFGLVMFFLLLMPLIPNRYSWLFAAIVGLTCIPLILYALLGWSVGKTVTRKIPKLNRFPRMSIAVFTLLIVCVLLFIPLAFPAYFDNADSFSGDIRIRADQQYYSPHLSSAKGLRLEITNLSGRELLSSRHTWSADYGYFIRVVPATSEVTILGNPVSGDDFRDIYWTYPTGDYGKDKKPVKIDLHLYPRKGEAEIANSSLALNWYTNDIVSVNRSG
ncbi:MAG: hypothetical protein WC586_02870 [Methanoregula sp.]